MELAVSPISVAALLDGVVHVAQFATLRSQVQLVAFDVRRVVYSDVAMTECWVMVLALVNLVGQGIHVLGAQKDTSRTSACLYLL